MSILVRTISDLFRGSRLNNQSPAASITDQKTHLTEQFRISAESGDIATAAKLLDQLASIGTNSEELEHLEKHVEFLKHVDIVSARLPGPRYLDWLEWFHTKLNPKTYIEIGVDTGKSLKFAQSSTRSIGIDPDFNVVFPIGSWAKLYRLPSDVFFANQNPLEIFDSQEIDFGFIDGLHTFDQALKDFINIEQYSSANSIVLLHDIFPVIPATTKRNRDTILWVGDTWKVVLALREYRPDLNFFTIPTYPSGLGVIANMNRASTVLRDQYHEIVERLMPLELEDLPEGLEPLLNLTQNDFSSVLQKLSYRTKATAT